MTRILVVEDEPAIALALEADFAMEGYDVVLAGDGTSGCRLALQGGFDLILLDLMLPGMDGYEICRRLRHKAVRTPIIILTAHTRPAEMVMGLDLGADDYVTKPFSPETLRARIRAVLRRAASRHQEEKCFRFGDAELDFERGELRRAGKPVRLTSMEFKILAALVRNRGRVLSRDALLDAACGPGYSVTDRAVDNHLMALRRKIEPDPEAPRYLVNVRGLGYRFEV